MATTELAVRKDAVAPSEVRKNPPNPEAHANFFQAMMISWLTRIFRLGNERALQEEDMYDLVQEDTARDINRRMAEAWQVEDQHTAAVCSYIMRFRCNGYENRRDARSLVHACAQTRGKAPVSVFNVLKRVFGRPFYYAGFIKFWNDLFVRVASPYVSSGVSADRS